MIRAIRPNAMAQDDATFISGWNISPNLAYVLILVPNPYSCSVLLYDESESVLIASGAALPGTEQPCVLVPQSGQSVEMVDAELGWHLLLTTTGTESQRTIRIGPAVDLPDEIHPIYGDDDMALARATAAINEAAHYIDDVTVTCLLGLGAGLGDVVGVPVDGAAVVGQVESITWAATPDGAIDQAVIRRHVAIAPEAFVEPVPPTVFDDVGTATNLIGSSGNVLANDDSGLVVSAINGLSSNVGLAVDGDNGGSFVVNSDGSWSFDPGGDFDLLGGDETADTSITYYASDGTLEAAATLTITVSIPNTPPVAADDASFTTSSTTTSGNVLSNDIDADLDILAVSQVSGSAANVGVPVAGSSGGLFTIAADGAWAFDPNSDFDSLTDGQTATTSVTYHVSDGEAEDEGTLTVTVSAAELWTPAEMSLDRWWDAADLSVGLVSNWPDKSGNGKHMTQTTESKMPYSDGVSVLTDGVDDELVVDLTYLVGTTYWQFCVVTHEVAYQYMLTSLNNVDRGLAQQYVRTTGCYWSHNSSGTDINYTTLLPAKEIGDTSILCFDYSSNTMRFWMDGVQRASLGTSKYLTSLNSGRLGRRASSPYYGVLRVHEIIATKTRPSDDLRKIIEGYASHKWDALLGKTDLVDELPVDHPYKTAPPVI